MRNMKKYFAVIVIAMLLTTTIFGSQITKKIEVVFNAIRLEVNGEKVEADNMVHDGTTYVPLREVSGLLGGEVSWEEETKTVHINDEKKEQEHPVATITMENGDEIKLELYPEVAPITVKNFISLVEQDFYKGLTFHRVIPGFMIQGGDPNGDGSGGAENPIKGEFAENGVENDILHERGILSMARTGNPNSASSQFFIVTTKAPSLDGKYAGFGAVTEGMDFVDEIVNTPTGPNDKPLTPQIIKNIIVEYSDN